jgi:hypothetical protein
MGMIRSYAIGSGRALFTLPGDRFYNATKPLEGRILDMTSQATEPLPERLRGLAVSLDGEYPPHTLADLRSAAEALDALTALLNAVCGETGFASAVRSDSGLAYPWPALDLAEEAARAALSPQP